MGDLADSAELMVSELVTNAIVHARSPSTVIARDDGAMLRVEVEDHGDGLCALREADAASDGGRGLRFVDTLAERWGCASTARGKTVWFELTCR